MKIESQCWKTKEYIVNLRNAARDLYIDKERLKKIHDGAKLYFCGNYKKAMEQLKEIEELLLRNLNADSSKQIVKNETKAFKEDCKQMQYLLEVIKNRLDNES